MSLIAEQRHFVSNCPSIDPDAPIDYGLTPFGWAAPCPEGDGELSPAEVMDALFAVKGE